MHNEKSRAMYGIDVMIDEETMEPKLLEITFSPDCKRACTYYPSFFNEVAETLFLDIIGENMERVIWLFIFNHYVGIFLSLWDHQEKVPFQKNIHNHLFESTIINYFYLFLYELMDDQKYLYLTSTGCGC